MPANLPLPEARPREIADPIITEAILSAMFSNAHAPEHVVPVPEGRENPNYATNSAYRKVR